MPYMPVISIRIATALYWDLPRYELPVISVAWDSSHTSICEISVRVCLEDLLNFSRRDLHSGDLKSILYETKHLSIGIQLRC